MKERLRRWALPFASLICAVAIAWSLPTVRQATDTRITAAETVILIDAGHGGFDGGATAADGTVEKEINLAVSRDLAAILRVMGYSVTMTRETDCALNETDAATVREKKVSDMKNRLALYENADLVISIHQNHFSQSKYHGAQVFYAPKNAQSQPFAAAIREKVIEYVQPQNTRELKKADNSLYLMSNTTVPTALVECGFLSNPAECAQLNDAAYRRTLALATAAGVWSFLGTES